MFSSPERVGSVLGIGLLSPFPMDFPVWGSLWILVVTSFASDGWNHGLEWPSKEECFICTNISCAPKLPYIMVCVQCIEFLFHTIHARGQSNETNQALSLALLSFPVALVFTFIVLLSTTPPTGSLLIQCSSVFFGGNAK